MSSKEGLIVCGAEVARGMWFDGASRGFARLKCAVVVAAVAVVAWFAELEGMCLVLLARTTVLELVLL